MIPTLEAPGDSAKPGEKDQQGRKKRRKKREGREGPTWKREEKEEKESVRFRGHQAEVAMITITACSYLTLVDPNQQAAKKQ